MGCLTFRRRVVRGRRQALDDLLFVSAQFTPGSHVRLMATGTSSVRIHNNTPYLNQSNKNWLFTSDSYSCNLALGSGVYNGKSNQGINKMGNKVRTPTSRGSDRVLH